MYDAIIIGAGPGGIECAKEINALGGKVALVEKDLIGGTCTNWGCIPTKALVHSCSLIKKGIKLDFSEINKKKDRAVLALRKGAELSLNDIEIIRGEAIVVSDKVVSVNGKDIEAKNIVIATGSEPIKIMDGMTSKDLLSLTEVPKKLSVVGGGVIGVEFAQIFRTLGSEVTIYEALPKILSNFDKDIINEVTNILKREGIKIETNKKVDRPKGTVLVAVGRQPVFPEVKIDVNMELNEKMQTSVPNIYAVGDCTGKFQLAHVASMQGIVAARNIMGKESSIDYTVPSCVYTIPEAASVGLKEDEVQNPTIIKNNYSANAMAKCSDERFGFVKIVAKDGVVFGVHIVGKNASDLITTATYIVKNKLTLDDIKNTIHPHPSFSELF